ncbi:unnamed protein product [Knipowitschia caucasica]
MASFGFTRASDQDVFRIGESHHPSPVTTNNTITGQEARTFYENLVKGEEKDAAKTCIRKKREKRLESRGVRVRAVSEQQYHVEEGVRVNGANEEWQEGQRGDEERRRELQGLRLLRCAHQGDTATLRDLLDKGANINFQDSYFWTGLMCASWAGHRAVVRLLLQRGAAWVGVVDLQGYDARDLATQAGHGEVVEEFDSFGKRERKDSNATESTSCLRQCEVCGTSYSERPSAHLSSTLHQFNLGRTPPAPHYCLPPSSAGFRMMLRSGWAPGRGLGPGGTGTSQPVPTRLKRDTLGLGYGRTHKAKVTHFKAMDARAVSDEQRQGQRDNRVGRGERRSEEERKEQSHKSWERDFRSSFYL